jgi:ribosomal protein S15P/S13E
MFNKMAEEEKEKKEEKTAKEEKIKENKKTLEEFKKKVLELAEKGLTSEKIGEKLRKEGYRSKEFNIKISKILGNKYINPDKKNLEEKLEKLEVHCKKNKGDKKALRAKDHLIARLRKLKNHLNLS